MKKRYEKSELVIWGSLVFFVLVLMFLIFLINKKLVLYEKFNGLIFNTDTLEFILSNSELDLFYQNKVFYIENKKQKFVIKNIDREIIKRNGEVYNHVFIETDISDKLKVNDVVEISIMNKSVKSINIFRVIWDGDLN